MSHANVSTQQLLQMVEQLDQVEFNALLQKILQIERQRKEVELASVEQQKAYEQEAMLRFVAAGGASWGGGKPEPREPIKLSKGGTPLSQIVIEDRG